LEEMVTVGANFKDMFFLNDLAQFFKYLPQLIRQILGRDQNGFDVLIIIMKILFPGENDALFGKSPVPDIPIGLSNVVQGVESKKPEPFRKFA